MNNFQYFAILQYYILKNRVQINSILISIIVEIKDQICLFYFINIIFFIYFEYF